MVVSYLWHVLEGEAALMALLGRLDDTSTDFSQRQPNATSAAHGNLHERADQMPIIDVGLPPQRSLSLSASVTTAPADAGSAADDRDGRGDRERLRGDWERLWGRGGLQPTAGRRRRPPQLWPAAPYVVVPQL